MTLEQATRAFEARFVRVVEFDPLQDRATHAPNGKPYIAYASGIEKPEGAPAHPDAIDARRPIVVRGFRARLRRLRLEGARTLYWRTRPEWFEDGLRKYIYCRFALGE